METISQVLFWVANSLLIPDILLLLLLFIRALLLVGGIYNQYMAKRKNDKRLNDLIKNLTPDKVDDLRKALPAKDNSLYIRYLRDLLTNPASQDYADYLISNFENDAEKDVILSKLLTKIGPVLGLIGTLIAMSPALVGLSTGDIAGMSYNMQVVFATTVVGLVISGVGLVSLQFKQRWYAKDVNNLDYVSRKLIEKTRKHETDPQKKQVRRTGRLRSAERGGQSVRRGDGLRRSADGRHGNAYEHDRSIHAGRLHRSENPGKENMEIIMKEGNKINKYTPSEQQGSGAKGKRVGIAYELENGEIIYVPE